MELYDIIINFSDYEFVRKLGNGAYGAVELYRNKNTKEEFAIKKFFDVTNKKNYMKEIVILFKMKHAAILQLRGFTIPSDSSEPLLIMTDYMKQGSLADILSAERCGIPPKDWDITKKAKIIFRIACALMYVHERGGSHRDIKPANILIDKDFNAYLGDFGLSTLNLSQSQSNFNGTPIYMAPEMFLGDQKITEKADIYSFAIVVYEMLSLEIPYKKFNNPFAISQFVTNGGRPDLDDSICPDMQTFITQCWDQNPSNRPSARAIVNHFMKYNLFPDADQEEFQNEIQILIGDKLPKKPDRSEWFDQSSSAPTSPKSDSSSQSSFSRSDSSYRFVSPKTADLNSASSSASNNHSYYRELPSSKSASTSSINNTKSPQNASNNNHSYYRELPSSPKSSHQSNTYYASSGSDNSSNNHSYYRELPTSPKSQQKTSPLSPFEQLKIKAQNGDSDAQFKVGFSYLKGFNGPAVNISQGINYLRQAADQKHPEACIILAKFYLSSDNYQDGVKYLSLAAALNNEEALVLLGDMLCTGDHVPKDVFRGVSLLRMAMKTVNDAKSLVTIGFRFYKIHNEELLVDARLCFKKGADLNNPQCIFNYGYMLERGEGGPKDVKGAICMYIKASEMNSIPAIMHLGEMCEEGRYMDTPNYDKALEMYNKAKRLGSNEAARAIERVEMRRRRRNSESERNDLGGLSGRDLLLGLMLKELLDF
ncbi:hypothetical protein M9Y10_006540 [Tritrichomonas musculus]|uniref:Protein kinase domain-containing protein n=1 Tax=Tritrichomonas musculus TaxID=1915356 RepID=A0ABR2JEG8_9EUKA